MDRTTAARLIQIADQHGATAHTIGDRVRVYIPWSDSDGRTGLDSRDVRSVREMLLALGY